jgi:two-component system, response regulator
MTAAALMNSRPILLVEDNPDDEMLALRALRGHRIANEIVVTRDGAEALDYLFCQGGFQARDVEQTPALVLLDLKLPKVSGLEVLARIKSSPVTKGIPVVMLTSSKEDQDLVASYNLGVNSYVRKPVAFEDFFQAVGQVGLYWLCLNEAPPKLP